jgi:hypothetical protein
VFIVSQDFSLFGVKIFTGQDSTVSEAYRAYGYLFGITFGMIAGVVRSTPELSDYDHRSAMVWAIACFVASLLFIVSSTSKANCRAHRLFRCGLYALAAFFLSVALNLRIWSTISLVDLVLAFNVLFGGFVLYFLVRSEWNARKELNLIDRGSIEVRERIRVFSSRISESSFHVSETSTARDEPEGWQAVQSKATSFVAVGGLIAVFIKVVISPF